MNSRRLTIHILLVICGITTLIGCGGGTTGTSPAQTLRFSGIIVNQQGEPLSSTPMTVVSGEDDQVLAEAATSDHGSFTMNLSNAPGSIAVRLNTGAESPSLDKQYDGASALAAQLSLTKGGRIKTDISFAAQLNTQQLCSALSVSGNALNLTAADSLQTCTIGVDTASDDPEPVLLRGTLQALCKDGTVKDFDIQLLQAGQSFSFPLAESYEQTCTPSQIVISSEPSGIQTSIVFEFIIQ